MTDTATPAAPPAPPALAVRRTVLALAATALLVVPSAVLFVATRQPAATYAAMGTLIGAMAVLAGGLRIGVLTSVAVGLLAPLSVVAGLSPVTGAALMALMTLIVGRLSTFGLHRSVMLVPMLLAWPMLSPVPWLPTAALTRINDLLGRFDLSLADALDRATARAGSRSPGSAPSALSDALLRQRIDSTYLAWIALFFFVGSILPVVLLPLIRRRSTSGNGGRTPTSHPRSETVPYTVTITVLSAAATFYFLEHPKLTSGSFLIATILVLTQVGNDVQWRLTVQRVLGTVGGVGLLAAVMALVGTVTYTEVRGVPVPLGLYGLGVAFGVVAIIAKFSPRQWIYYALITPAAALLNAYTTAQAGDLGRQRLVDNLVGAALVVAAALVTLVAGRIMARDDDHDEVAADPAPSPA